MLAELVLGITLIVVAYFYVFKKPEGLPPGEYGYPIVGQIPNQDKPFMYYVEEMRKKFGDIFYWKMGHRTFVFLCNFNLIKTAFNNPLLVDRPNFYSILNFALGKFLGIKESNGASWQNVRRFSVRYLRDRGMGKSSLIPEIENEVEHLVDEFSKHTNQPNEIPWSLNVAVLNVTWKMVADRRYDVSNKEVQRFQRLITDMFDAFQGYIILIDLMPWIGNLMPKFLKRKLGIQQYHDSVEEMYVFLRQVVKESLENKDPSRPKTIVDAYVDEMKKGDKSEYASTFTEDDLLVTLGDLFTAGSDTTSSTIRWILLYLSKYPDIQKKVQDELDTVVPVDRYPSLEDRDRLPYTNAVFHEVMRIMPLLPVSFYHSASEDTSINEYKIPKGTVIVGSIISCHKDPKNWKNPEEFYPEHFLNDDGSFNGKKDGFLPFSTGRRSCIGESLARMQVYLMAAALLQKFTFEEIPGEELTLEVDTKQPLFNLPIKFRILFKDRVPNTA